MELGSKGNYFISKLKNSGAGFFSKQKRKLGGSSTCTPGPGSYIMPSDFGVYQSNKPIKTKGNRIRSAPVWKKDLSRSTTAGGRPKRPATSGNGRGRRKGLGRRKSRTRPQTSKTIRRSEMSGGS